MSPSTIVDDVWRGDRSNSTSARSVTTSPINSEPIADKSTFASPATSVASSAASTITPLNSNHRQGSPGREAEQSLLSQQLSLARHCQLSGAGLDEHSFMPSHEMSAAVISTARDEEPPQAAQRTTLAHEAALSLSMGQLGHPRVASGMIGTSAPVLVARRSAPPPALERVSSKVKRANAHSLARTSRSHGQSRSSSNSPRPRTPVADPRGGQRTNKAALERPLTPSLALVAQAKKLPPALRATNRAGSSSPAAAERLHRRVHWSSEDTNDAWSDSSSSSSQSMESKLLYVATSDSKSPQPTVVRAPPPSHQRTPARPHHHTSLAVQEPHQLASAPNPMASSVSDQDELSRYSWRDHAATPKRTGEHLANHSRGLVDIENANAGLIAAMFDSSGLRPSLSPAIRRAIKGDQARQRAHSSATKPEPRIGPKRTAAASVPRKVTHGFAGPALPTSPVDDKEQSREQFGEFTDVEQLERLVAVDDDAACVIASHSACYTLLTVAGAVLQQAVRHRLAPHDRVPQRARRLCPCLRPCIAASRRSCKPASTSRASQRCQPGRLTRQPHRFRPCD